MKKHWNAVIDKLVPHGKKRMVLQRGQHGSAVMIHLTPAPLTFSVTHASEAGGRTCRPAKNQRSTETASNYKDHKVSYDYQHKEERRRRRRGLKRKASAHSSEEREGGGHGGQERRNKCRTNK